MKFKLNHPCLQLYPGTVRSFFCEPEGPPVKKANAIREKRLAFFSLLLIFSLILPMIASSPVIAQGPVIIESPIIGRNHPLASGQVMLFKTAERVPNKVNTWKITLRVEARDKQSPADIVLVIDQSHSMLNGNRLPKAKEAASAFIEKLMPTGSLSDNFRIGVVTYDSQIVSVADMTNDPAPLHTLIDNIMVDARGATFTQTGLKTARDMLAAVTNPASHQYIVLLSDGEPNYGYLFNDLNSHFVQPDPPLTTAATYYDIHGSNSNPSWAGGTIDISYVTALETISGPGDFNYAVFNPLDTDTRAGKGGNLYCEVGEITENNDYFYDLGASTIAEAGFAKNLQNLLIHTVALEAGKGLPILEAVSSGGGYHHEVNTPDDLKGIFETIADSIGTSIDGAITVDPMGTGFTVAGIIDDSHIEVSPNGGTASKTDDHTIVWNIGTLKERIEDQNYSDIRYAQISYEFTIDDSVLTAPVISQDEDSEENLYFSNGATSITYIDANGESVTQPFPTPLVDPLILYVTKEVIGVDGTTVIADDPQEFEITVTNGGSFTQSFDLAGGETDVSTLLRDVGTYSFFETPVAGYETTYYVRYVPSESWVEMSSFSVEQNGKDPYILVRNRQLPGKLIVTKSISPSEKATTTFPIEVSTSDGGLINPAVGTGQTVTDGSSLEFVVMPGTYTVMEDLTGMGGWNASYTCDQVVVPPGGEETCEIINTYTATGNWAPEGMKILTGRIMTAGEFTFSIMEGDPATVVSTGTNAADGTITFDPINYAFSDIGTHTYTITENIASLPGSVTADDPALEYTVIVQVSDQEDGTLAISVSSGPTGGIVFNNTYTSFGALQLSGTKSLSGRVLADGEFNFELYEGTDTSGIPIETVQNAAGVFTFTALNFDQDDIPVGQTTVTKTYTVIERNDGPGGVAYDGTVYTVEVTLTDDGNGTITAPPVYKINDSTVPEIVFNNDYGSSGAAVIYGIKRLSGSALSDGEFTFMLDDGSGNPLPSTNDQDGNFTFGPILYDLNDVANSPLRYTIYEVPGTDGSIVYDGTVYTIEVVLTDDGSGNIIVNHQIFLDNGDPAPNGLLFENVTLAGLTVQKAATPKTASPFNFELERLPLADGSDAGKKEAPFALIDDGLQHTPRTDQILFENIAPGRYRLEEKSLPDGWELSSVECEGTNADGNMEPLPFDQTGNAIEFTLAAAQSAHCTYNNKAPFGEIIVDKVTWPAGDPTVFNFLTTGNEYDPFSLSDTDAPHQKTLKAGPYSVTEDNDPLVSGFYHVHTHCMSNIDGKTQISSQINLEDGETVRCTFYNAKPGVVGVLKQVINPFDNWDEFNFVSSLPDLNGIHKIGSSDFAAGDVSKLNGNPAAWLIKEIVPGGWQLYDIQCNEKISGLPTTFEIDKEAVEVRVQPNLGPNQAYEGIALCTFTNTRADWHPPEDPKDPYDPPVEVAGREIPRTGFSVGRITALPEQTAAKLYAGTGLTLRIPAMQLEVPIVGVPETEDGWDLTWLGSDAGWLAGSAFPTWNGNTVLTAHVWDSWDRPGPFASLKSLRYGDKFTITAYGVTYTYETRSNELIGSKDLNSLLKHEEQDWVTLVTCEDYSEAKDNYLSRRMVRAVLVRKE